MHACKIQLVVPWPYLALGHDTLQDHPGASAREVALAKSALCKQP